MIKTKITSTICINLLALILPFWILSGNEPSSISSGPKWIEATTRSPSYTKASAHEPNFHNKELWPKLKGNEYFLQEKWPQGKLMVWAKPGQNGGKRAKGLDPYDPTNWLENGKPCKEVKFDENTDVLFPASEKPYWISFRDEDWPEIYRHVTVEKGCVFAGGGDGRGRKIYGNVWIKQGAGISAQGATQFLGNRHTFFRNDNIENPELCSQYFSFNKVKDKSVEFFGHIKVLDEFNGESGIIIVGEDSWVQPGRNASPYLRGGAILALMDGARFGSWQNNFGTPDLQVTNAHVWGGLPDRPLKRSCFFEVNFKNYTQAMPAWATDKDKERSLPRVPSLVFRKDSSIRSYTQNFSQARLCFKWSGLLRSSLCIDPQHPEGKLFLEKIKKNPQQVEHELEKAKWFAALPKGIDLWIDKEVTIYQVEFDHVRKEGMMLATLELKNQFQNILWGPNCLGKKEELFSVVPSLQKGNRY